jgi:ATP-dependent Clp protease ATP-binding subunit ClpA
MFERFTGDAREVVVTAQEEARELGHDFIGTEHVLLGLLAHQDSPVAAALRDSGVDAEFVRGELVRRVGPRPPGKSYAETEEEDAAALKAIGIDLDAVRRAIEENFGEGSLRLPREAPAPKRRGLFGRSYAYGGHIPFSSRNKKVLELSLREAVHLNQKFLAPEHIMLGMIREGDGLAMLILTDKGVDIGKLRADLTRSLRDRVA